MLQQKSCLWDFKQGETQTNHRGYKTFSMLNAAVYEIYHALNHQNV